MSLAQRYASRMQRITLAQRIDDLMEDRALAAQDANDDEDVIDVDNDDYAGGTQAITSYDGKHILVPSARAQRTKFPQIFKIRKN